MTAATIPMATGTPTGIRTYTPDYDHGGQKQ